MSAMQPEHSATLRGVLKLEEETGRRYGLTRQETFADLIDRLLAGAPVEKAEAVELAGWMRTMANRSSSEEMKRGLRQAAEAIEKDHL